VPWAEHYLRTDVNSSPSQPMKHIFGGTSNLRPSSIKHLPAPLILMLSSCVCSRSEAFPWGTSCNMTETPLVLVPSLAQKLWFVSAKRAARLPVVLKSLTLPRRDFVPLSLAILGSRPTTYICLNQTTSPLDHLDWPHRPQALSPTSPILTRSGSILQSS